MLYFFRRIKTTIVELMTLPEAWSEGITFHMRIDGIGRLLGLLLRSIDPETLSGIQK